MKLKDERSVDKLENVNEDPIQFKMNLPKSDMQTLIKDLDYRPITKKEHLLKHGSETPN